MKKLLMLLALTLFVVSCSDDDDNPVNPDPNKVYMPLKAGNYWLYDTYDLDMQNQINTETKQVDSLVSGEKTTYLLKEAYLLKQFTDGELNGNYHFYTEAGSVFAESNYILPLNTGFGLPIDKITNQWVKIADFSSTNWNVLTHQFANESISIPQLPSGIKLNASYTVSAARSSNKVPFTLNAVNYDSYEITLTHRINGTLSYLLISAPLDFTITQKIYFVENIGIVKSITQSQKITVNLGMLGNQSFDINGHQKTLTNFKLQ